MFVSIWLVLVTPSVWAASCCGGSNGQTALITTDHQSTFQASASQAAVIGASDARGNARRRPEDFSERTQALDLGVATLLSDRFQIGAAASFQQRLVETSAKEEAYRDSGDSSVQLAYEFLPEYDYSSWRPKGFAFLELTLPTGQAPRDAQSVALTDITGRGFYRLAAGSVFAKQWRSWSTSISIKFTRFLDTQPYWGASSSIQGGYAGLISATIGLSPSFEGLASGPRQIWDLQAGLGYPLQRNLLLSVTYADETLLAAWSRNTVLSRTFGLQLRKSWDR